jgi:mannose PTS system EIIA component
MSVALFFITHEGIASNLISIGNAVLQKTDNNLSYYEIPMDADLDHTIACIEDDIAQLDTEEGILFITDMYGSTPSNIAQQLADIHHAKLISGVNLPMVIRLLNYREDKENSLVEKALDGAIQGIQHNN